MRVGLMILPLLFLAACLQQQNGNEVQLEKPFILGDQAWQISEQDASPKGDRVCSVSAGELTVTQYSHAHVIKQQVGTSNRIDIGDRYKVLAGAHVYETLESNFNAGNSHSIIRDLKKYDVIYTETRVLDSLHGASVWRSIDNKIPTAGFAEQYEVCTRFVKSPKS